MPKLNLNYQQHRQVTGDYTRKRDLKQGSQKSQDIRIHKLASLSGVNPANQNSYNTYFAIVHIISLLASIQSKPHTLLSERMKEFPETKKMPSGDIFNTVKNTLSYTDKFISHYDPLKFPGAAALPLMAEENITNEINDELIDDVSNKRKIELEHSFYNVSHVTHDDLFIKAGKKAISKFYQNYNTQYPNIHTIARMLLTNKIKTKFNLEIDPDQTLFIRFEFIEYDGVQRIQHPPFKEKRTLTQCLFTNFSAKMQENRQDIDNMCGIYDAQEENGKSYYPANAVKITPLQFIDLVTDINFYDYAVNRIKKSYINKDPHIKKCFLDIINHLDISDIAFAAATDVFNGVGITENKDVSVSLFDIDGYTAENAYLFKNNNGRVTLYLPESEFKFIAFRGMFEMRAWVTNACATEKHRKMIASHFSLADRQDGTFYYGIDNWLRSIGNDQRYYTYIAIKSSPIASEHFFTTFVDNKRNKYIADLDLLIKSDAEVTRDIWEDMIDASNIIPNPVSPFLSLAIHIEHIIDADTYSEKHQEINKLENDLINLVTMITFDKALKFTHIDGYEFINEVKNGVAQQNTLFDKPQSTHVAKNTHVKQISDFVDDSSSASEAEDNAYNYEEKCFRVKRGGAFGKMCVKAESSEEILNTQSGSEFFLQQQNHVFENPVEIAHEFLDELSADTLFQTVIHDIYRDVKLEDVIPLGHKSCVISSSTPWQELQKSLSYYINNGEKPIMIMIDMQPALVKSSLYLSDENMITNHVTEKKHLKMIDFAKENNLPVIDVNYLYEGTRGLPPGKSIPQLANEVNTYRKLRLAMSSSEHYWRIIKNTDGLLQANIKITEAEKMAIADSKRLLSIQQFKEKFPNNPVVLMGRLEDVCISKTAQDFLKDNHHVLISQDLVFDAELKNNLKGITNNKYGSWLYTAEHAGSAEYQGGLIFFTQK